MSSILGLSILLLSLIVIIVVIGLLVFVLKRSGRSKEMQHNQMLEEEKRKLKEN